MYNSTTHNHKKPRLRDRTDRAWLIMRPGNGADLFLQPRSRTGQRSQEIREIEDVYVTFTHLLNVSL